VQLVFFSLRCRAMFTTLVAMWCQSLLSSESLVSSIGLKQVKKTKKVRQTSGVQVVVPYVKGLTEAVSRIFNKFGAGVASKPHRTIRNELVHPKDKV